MSEKSNNLHTVTSITSHGDIMDAADHEVDLKHVTSNPLSINQVAVDFSSSQKYYVLKRLNYDKLESLDDLPVSATFMLEKIQGLPVEEAVEILRDFLEIHKYDVNVPTHEIKFIEALLDYRSPESDAIDARLDRKEQFGEDVAEEQSYLSDFKEADIFDWELQVKTEAGIIAYHSPYPEVRAVTDPYDDPNEYCETFRVYLLGIIWTAIGSFVNEFFMERQPAITLNASVVQLLLYPSGVLCHWIFPKYKFKVWKYTIDLNPGPWNFKEQMLATVFYSVSGGTPYVSYNIPVMKMDMFYGVKWATWGYQILLMLSVNYMGFGFAGIMRKFTVYPTRAIWPTLLPTLALNKALLLPEPRERINGWTISRYYFFMVVFAASFLWFWFPDYLFQALSTFNWMTWISPNNLNLAMITGSVGGLGLNPIPTFDWNVLNFNNALSVPFYSQLNQYIGSIIAFFSIIGVWWSNYKWTSFLPLNSNGLFTNTGETYSVTAILNDQGLVDTKLYQQYGPPYYTAANLVLYGAFFAIYPFTVLYVGLTEWSHISFAFKGLYQAIKDFKKSTYDGFKDPFTRSMTKYKEVPEWAFLIILVISVALAIACVEAYPTNTPVWGIFFALGINFVFLIPITLVYSITGFSFGLNVLVELIVGYALPGNGQALMFIKAIGYNIDGQAQNYVTDQKMAHYTRVPPRALFRVQMLSVLICSFVSLAVINFSIDNITDYCMKTQAQKFTCPSARTFYSASVLWGVIGPKKVFNGLYPILQYCFLIGALLAPVCFAVKKYFRHVLAVRFFQPVLIIGGFLVYAPYNLSYYTGGLYLSFAFMYYIRKYYINWFKKYNYVLSGALSAGVALSSVIIFFAVQYHEKDVNWWGNTVMYAGLDAEGPPLKDISEAPDGYFGPRVGHFP